MKREITPIIFASALRSALDYRSAGMSQIEAASQACQTYDISTDWAYIIQAVLNDSSWLAEAWAERIREQSLDRIGEKL